MKASLCLILHQGLVKGSYVHYSEQWEGFGLSTVGEKMSSCIAGKQWLLSALKRMMNKQCTIRTVVRRL